MKYYLTYISLYALFFSSAHATLDSPYTYWVARGDSLYQEGNYNKAALSYERYIFISPASPSSARVLLKKAYCLKQEHLFEQALYTLERAPFARINDTLHYKIRYEMALCAYLAENYPESNAQLIQIQHYIRDTALTNQSLYLKILVLNALWEWEKAKKVCAEYIRQHNLKTDIDTLYAFLEHPRIRNQQTAKLLSTFIPGAGQIYAGAPLEGLFNAALQLAAISFGVYNILHKYYLTGFTVGASLFQSLYFGGIQRAMTLVEQKNRIRAKEYNDKIKRWIVEQERDQRN